MIQWYVRGMTTNNSNLDRQVMEIEKDFWYKDHLLTRELFCGAMKHIHVMLAGQQLPSLNDFLERAEKHYQTIKDD